MLPTSANTYSEKESRSGVYNTEMELTFKQSTECIYTKWHFYTLHSPPPLTKKKMEGENFCAQLSPPSPAVSLEWKKDGRTENGAASVQKPNVLCADMFVRAGIPSTGCWYISEEYRRLHNQFQLEPVLSNMSHRSISKVCSLFLL